MNDEQRADRLAQALDHAMPTPADGQDHGTHAASPQDAGAPPASVSDQDDAELADLIRFGQDLRRLTPQIAAFTRYQEAFDPTFAQQLKQRLLASHPAATHDETHQSGEVATMGAPHAAQPHARLPKATGWRAAVRRFRLPILAFTAAAVLLVVLSLQYSLQQPGLNLAQATITPAQTLSPGIVQAARIHGGGTPVVAGGFSPVTTATIVPAKQQGQFAPHYGPMTTTKPARSPGGASAGGQGAGGTTEPSRPLPRISTFSATSPVPSANAGTKTAQPRAGSASQIALQYALPSHLPVLPVTAPIYTLHYHLLSAPAAQAIAARFSGLRRQPVSVGLAYANGAERLQITASTGAITYTATEPAPRLSGGGSPLAAGSARWSSAVARARLWLKQHDLYPPPGTVGATMVTRFTDLTQVRFAPALPGVSGATVYGSMPALTVDLDSGGRVLLAIRLWPQVIVTAPRRLVGVAAALHSAGAVAVGTLVAARGSAPVRSPVRARAQQPTHTTAVPSHGNAPVPPPSPVVAPAARMPASTARPTTAPLFTISTIRLVFVPGAAPAPTAAAGTLVPRYLLQGQLHLRTGVVEPYSMLLAAT